jgi:predicted DNA binding CopG/RHH family protein
MSNGKKYFEGGESVAEKRKTKTSSAVKNRYNNRVYGSVIVRIPKDMAEAFKAKCAATGTPQAQIVKKAIEQFLEE